MNSYFFIIVNNYEYQTLFHARQRMALFKIYTGSKSSDRLLTTYLGPILDRMAEEKLINQFFFIRYGDPYYHIRLRLHINDANNYSRIFSMLYSSMDSCLENKLVSKIMCDTYRREIERYGFNTMKLSEDIFAIDSDSIIKLLTEISVIETDKEQMRWLIALRLIDDTLTEFGFDMTEKRQLIAHFAEIFRQEHRLVGKHFTKQLNDKYRASASPIEDFFKGSLTSRYNEILEKRRESIGEIAAIINSLHRNNELAMNYHNLIGSYMHMTINRLFRTKNRLCEMVAYHFLEKYYNSEIARAKLNINH